MAAGKGFCRWKLARKPIAAAPHKRRKPLEHQPPHPQEAGGKSSGAIQPEVDRDDRVQEEIDPLERLHWPTTFCSMKERACTSTEQLSCINERRLNGSLSEAAHYRVIPLSLRSLLHLSANHDGFQHHQKESAGRNYSESLPLATDVRVARYEGAAGEDGRLPWSSPSTPFRTNVPSQASRT